ncbi:MAG TPA: DEAD/DEAH box helicase [Solirubrobacteraceae bacterium]|nr:DEAD/DEAH box helicase [Solirubrobacteraceae bacterium]
MATAKSDPLAAFSPATRAWFEASFAKPTPAQAQAWPAIASGEHVLLSAPTGSGKTLAAFLWALDRLSADGDVEENGMPPARAGGIGNKGATKPAREDLAAPENGMSSRTPTGTPKNPNPNNTPRNGGGVRVVYVSPLKALSYDIERNLRAPLRGIGANVSVGIRTGDTSQAERAAMARKPPEILITTPESLYLILGSRARAMLGTVETVIVDEIHAVASVKRGAHLALTLERLEQQVRSARGPDAPGVQRVGLSATQNPLEEVGRFLVGPTRRVRILDAGARKPLDLRIHVPVESMGDLAGPVGPQSDDPLQPVQGSESTRNSIWPAIYPELLRLVREHRSTIVFVNNRRSAERVALRLNELAAAEQDVLESSDADGNGLDGAALTGGLRGVPVDQPGPVAPREIARAHHGSLSREERTMIEEQLKAGELPCLVATSSLELGIDMGAVDLVLQIESPKSVARGLQRIGRAGHGVGDVSKGRIFPKFRGDLLECAVVCRRMREGAIEPTVVPRNALDVLAQQIVAIAASAEDGARIAAAVPAGEGCAAGDGTPPGVQSSEVDQDGSVGVDDLHELVTRTHSYSELPRALLENVLDMLDGRYPSSEFGELRARIVWDRVAGCIRARKGARQLAVVNAGTIPDRGLYAVTLPDGRRVGELDEEMVYEARPGQVFLLGASSWRIEEIGRDRVIVTPAPGVPGAVPFWKGDGIGRPKELGKAIGAFTRWAVDQDAELLVRDYDLDERSAANLLDYLREQQAATQVLPSDRTIVLERFRDEIGDWRLCVLSPFGGRVHAAWGLAISARMRERFGIDGEAIWSDDGIVVRLPDVDLDEVEEWTPGTGEASNVVESPDTLARPNTTDPTIAPPRGWAVRGVESSGSTGAASYADLVALDPQEVEEAIVAELGDSALFGARFRENAARALLIPRAYPGRRTPLWQQRLKAQGLLQVARRYPDFPIVLETYRECLRDVLDLPGLQELLRGLATREVSLVEVETQSASPFAGSLLFDYVATYMYEGDTPSAERRAAALSLDRDLLRELLGQEELRELIDPAALVQIEQDLQHLSQRTQATSRDALGDVLRAVGDLRVEELGERVLTGLDAREMLAALEHERRVVRVRIAGDERLIAADDAGLYRDALGCPSPAGLPGVFTAEVPDALVKLVARYARTHGPFTSEELFERYRVDVSSALRELERSGGLVRGELRPGVAPAAHPEGHTLGGAGKRGASKGQVADRREWCDVEVLRRLRRASLASLRKEIEPVDERALSAFMPSWQGVDRWQPGSERGGGGVERLREVLVPLQGLALPVPSWERDVLACRTGSYSPAWLDSLCASGEVVWVGAGSLGRGSGRVALYFREDAPLLGPPSLPAGARGEPPAQPEHALLRERLAVGPCFFTDLLVELEVPGAVLTQALWDLVWAGEVTNDAWAPLRAPRQTLAAHALARPTRARSGGLRGGRRFGGPSPRAGRFGTSALVQGRWSLTLALFAAEAPRERDGRPDGIEELRGRRRALAELLLERYGLLTREQVSAEGVAGGFSALYGALSELETLGVCRRGYFVEGLGGAQFALPGAVERLRARSHGETASLVLAAVDPAQPYGAVLPWPQRAAQARRPARVAGAYVVFVADRPVLYLERGGRGILTFASEATGLASTSARLASEATGRASASTPLAAALRALADAVRAGRVDAVALERIDGESAIGSELEPALVDLGFRQGPRRLTLRA